MQDFNLRSFRDFVLFALAIVGIIILSSDVFAANINPPTPLNNCWEFVACGSYTDVVINSDDNKETCAIVGLDYNISDSNSIIIEIFQGGINSDRHHYFIYNSESESVGLYNYYFEMSKDTVPTYILCTGYNPALAKGDYTTAKTALLDRWFSTTEIVHTTTKEYEEVLTDNDISRYLFGSILALMAIAIIYFSIYSIIKGR